ncbi:MAG: M50 family metallopeptidase [Bacteroidetes bacterium]|nr:M50 family metallopeptidase [Bacteroidota bacterium]
MEKFFQNPTVIFYTLLACCLVITRLPLIGKFFRVVNTLIHESGHAIMALLLSGKVHRIDLFSDTSGSALTATKNGFSRFLVSLAGYPTSALFAFLCFYLIEQNSGIYVVYIITGIAILNLILYVRNAYGIFWLISFIAIAVFIVYKKNQFIINGFSLLCSFIILTDAVISGIHLLVIAIKSPKTAGDAKNLNEATHLPIVFWALVLLAFSVVIAYKTIWMFFPKLF